MVWRLILSLISVVVAAIASTDEQDNVWQVCLKIESINLEHLKWGPDSRNAKASPQGVVYAYSAHEPVDTFKMLQFSLATSSTLKLLPSSFTFDDKDSVVGCWTEPSFHELDVRFKVYQHDYTALKATTKISIPSISSATLSDNVTLDTLPYRYHDVTVVVTYSLQWILKASPQIESTLAVASNDVLDAFDSDEVVDAMMTNDFITEDDESSNGDGQPKMDWMLTAAFCSSIVGLLMLLFVCIRAYKHCVRSEYEQIYLHPDGDVVKRKTKTLGKIRKISLRNLGGSDERKKIIIPSVPSYT